MIDCGKCGAQVRLDGDVFVCTQCGKSYTREQADERKQGLKKLDQMRKWLIALLAGCMVFLIISAILLPGYAGSGKNTGLIILTTAICLGLFLAAVVLRILFGRERKKLYPGR